MKIWREKVTTDRRGEINKCFWQVKRHVMGGQRLRRTRFYIFQWDERRRRKQTKWPKQARSHFQSSLLQAFFSRQDCNKTSSRLQQVLRQRIVSNGALWTSEKLFSFTSMMDVTRDRTQREEYSSVKLNIDRFHSVEFFHLQRVSIIIYLTNFKLSQSIIAIILVEKTYIYFYPY